MFSNHPRELGVETVTWHVRIWNSEENDAPGTARPYTRGDHDDHIHVAFTREGSRQQPPILLVYFEEFASPTG